MANFAFNCLLLHVQHAGLDLKLSWNVKPRYTDLVAANGAASEAQVLGRQRTGDCDVVERSRVGGVVLQLRVEASANSRRKREAAPLSSRGGVAAEARHTSGGVRGRYGLEPHDS